MEIRAVESLFISHFFFVAMIPVQAQIDTANSNSLTEEALALQFGIRNSLLLSQFQGGTVSAQYHLSSTRAVRIGITLSGAADDRTLINSQLEDGTAVNSSDATRSGTSANVSLDLQHLWYSSQKGVVLFYTGMGPHVQYSYATYEQITRYTPPSSVLIANTSVQTTLWSLGVSALAGVEWFPAERFSLHADYTILVTYQLRDSENRSSQTTTGTPSEIGNKTEEDIKTWQLSNFGVNFGLSVYFH